MSGAITLYFDTRGIVNIESLKGKINTKFQNFLDNIVNLPIAKKWFVEKIDKSSIEILKLDKFFTRGFFLIPEEDKNRYLDFSINFYPEFIIGKFEETDELGIKTRIFSEIFSYYSSFNLVYGDIVESSEMAYSFFDNLNNYLKFNCNGPIPSERLVEIRRTIEKFLETSPYVRKIENVGYIVSHLAPDVFIPSSLIDLK